MQFLPILTRDTLWIYRSARSYKWSKVHAVLYQEKMYASFHPSHFLARVHSWAYEGLLTNSPHHGFSKSKASKHAHKKTLCARTYWRRFVYAERNSKSTCRPVLQLADLSVQVNHSFFARIRVLILGRICVEPMQRLFFCTVVGPNEFGGILSAYTHK